MAKKRKGSAKHKGGRRRMGAVKVSDTGKMIAGGFGGGFGAAILDTKFASTQNPKIRGLVLMGVGVVAALKSKNKYVQGGGIGVAVYGGLRLASGLGVVTLTGVGCGDGMSGTRRRMNGFADVPGIGGANVRQFPAPAAVGNARTRAVARLAAGAGL